MDLQHHGSKARLNLPFDLDIQTPIWTRSAIRDAERPLEGQLNRDDARSRHVGVLLIRGRDAHWVGPSHRSHGHTKAKHGRHVFFGLHYYRPPCPFLSEEGGGFAAAGFFTPSFFLSFRCLCLWGPKFFTGLNAFSWAGSSLRVPFLGSQGAPFDATQQQPEQSSPTGAHSKGQQ